MFTNCPECGTVFRISTQELRMAEGQVRCGHCSATFNALASLSEEPPPTVTLQQLVLPAETEVVSGAEPSVAATPISGFPEEPVAAGGPPELQAAGTWVPLPVIEDTLEFDIPEDGWSDFFEGETPRSAEAPPEPEPEIQPGTQADIGADLGSATVDQAGLYRALSMEAAGLNLDDDDDWRTLLAEVPDDETPDPVYVIGEQTLVTDPSWVKPAPLPADLTGEWALPASLATLPGSVAALPSAEAPAPIADLPFIWKPPPAAPETRTGHWGYTAGSAVLALMLVIQVLHHQRDELATHPALTEPLQRTYAALGLPLWPAWDLRAYALRNSEAVADRSSPGALDILARIAVVGTEPVGLPLVRVTLRDRFSQPVGTRIFEPAEYLARNSRPREPVSPGTMIPVEISLKDPGADAQGFDVDICLMNRRDGIVCRSEREPFAR